MADQECTLGNLSLGDECPDPMVDVRKIGRTEAWPQAFWEIWDYLVTQGSNNPTEVMREKGNLIQLVMWMLRVDQSSLSVLVQPRSLEYRGQVQETRSQLWSTIFQKE